MNSTKREQRLWELARKIADGTITDDERAEHERLNGEQSSTEHQAMYQMAKWQVGFWAWLGRLLAGGRRR